MTRAARGLTHTGAGRPVVRGYRFALSKRSRSSSMSRSTLAPSGATDLSLNPSLQGANAYSAAISSAGV